MNKTCIAIFIVVSLFTDSVMPTYVRPPRVELNETETEQVIAKRLFFAIPFLAGVKLAVTGLVKAAASGKIAGALSAIGSKTVAFGGSLVKSASTMATKFVTLAKNSHFYAGKLKEKVNFIKDNFKAANSIVDTVTGLFDDVNKKAKLYHGKLSGIVGYDKMRTEWPLTKAKAYVVVGRKKYKSPIETPFMSNQKPDLETRLYRKFCVKFIRKIGVKKNAEAWVRALCGVGRRARSLEGTVPNPLDKNVTEYSPAM